MNTILETKLLFMVTETTGLHPVFDKKILLIGTWKECNQLWTELSRKNNYNYSKYKIESSKLPN